jgi:hypothetical protein
MNAPLDEPATARALARRAWALALAATCIGTHAQTPPERRNWFDDPFFQISHAVPGCPVPVGPRLTEAERRVEAHHRAERGTTCWLAGQCRQPNAYAYDAGIAAAFQSALKSGPTLAGSTLWVTVQGRVVYIEGCAGNAVAAALETMARALPDVQQAMAIVYAGPPGTPPYKRLSADRP